MNLYLTNRFFTLAFTIVGILILSYSYPWLYSGGVVLLWLLAALAIGETIWVYFLSKKVYVDRYVQQQLSLGDNQKISYTFKNNNETPLKVELTDELPYQLQFRSSIYKGELAGLTSENLKQSIRPTERGKYEFGNVHLFISTRWLALIELKKTYNREKVTEVYPSFMQMKSYELQVFSQTATLAGIRKVREIGENDEFEQIRNYVVGDNVKSINWKATSRRGELMVNQYENSKSQMVYCIIDKGRAMKMPFDELSLLDYAINTTLVTSNIILKKYDKIGLITFSNKMGAIIGADSQKGQIQKITKTLYDQKTEFQESDFRLLYHTIRQRVRRRSVLLLFTNFEHPQDMRRQIQYLRSLNKSHLLVVIFFTNAEIEAAANSRVSTVKELYERTFAQENIMDKERMVRELQRNGIQVILSKPTDLSVNTINKYLEIKSKRMK